MYKFSPNLEVSTVDVIESKLVNEHEVVLSNALGSALYMIQTLRTLGVITLGKEEYNKLKKLLNAPELLLVSSPLDINDLKLSINMIKFLITRYVTKGPNEIDRIVWQGNLLNGNAPNDYSILLILRQVQKMGVRSSITYSRGDELLLWQFFNSNSVHTHFNSHCNLALLREYGVITTTEIEALLGSAYDPQRNLINYSLSADGTLNLYPPVAFPSEVYLRLAAMLELTFDASSVEALASSIETINEKVRKENLFQQVIGECFQHTKISDDYLMERSAFKEKVSEKVCSFVEQPGVDKILQPVLWGHGAFTHLGQGRFYIAKTLPFAEQGLRVKKAHEETQLKKAKEQHKLNILFNNALNELNALFNVALEIEEAVDKRKNSNDITIKLRLLRDNFQEIIDAVNVACDNALYQQHAALKKQNDKLAPLKDKIFFKINFLQNQVDQRWFEALFFKSALMTTGAIYNTGIAFILYRVATGGASKALITGGATLLQKVALWLPQGSSALALGIVATVSLAASALVFMLALKFIYQKEYMKASACVFVAVALAVPIAFTWPLALIILGGTFVLLCLANLIRVCANSTTKNTVSKAEKKDQPFHNAANSSDEQMESKYQVEDKEKGREHSASTAANTFNKHPTVTVDARSLFNRQSPTTRTASAAKTLAAGEGQGFDLPRTP